MLLLLIEHRLPRTAWTYNFTRDATTGSSANGVGQPLTRFDQLYALEASHDYDPNPGLEKIKAPLLAINSADDLINPPELGILEREIKRVAHGRAVVIPLSDRTRGHGSHTLAALWKTELVRLLAETEK